MTTNNNNNNNSNSLKDQLKIYYENMYRNQGTIITEQEKDKFANDMTSMFVFFLESLSDRYKHLRQEKQ